MFLVDTVSRVHLTDVSACHFARSLQDVNHTASHTLIDDQLLQFKHVSANDPVLQVLGEMIRHGCLKAKSDVPDNMHA